MAKKKLFAEFALLIAARANCEKLGNDEWFDKHGDKAESLAREHLPSGSGFDAGSTLDLERSKPDRLVFVTSFHHMNEGGMYDGWTEHTVIVTPSLAFGFDLRVTGRDRNDIKDYIAESFNFTLSDVEVE